PTGLSANADTSAVAIPKQRFNPRATLYSPPPSHTRNWRAVWMRPSPGSNRSITSPSATRSQRRPGFGGMSSGISSPREPAAVDDQHVPVHVARGGRCEEHDRAGDIHRRAPPSGPNPLEDLPAAN